MQALGGSCPVVRLSGVPTVVVNEFELETAQLAMRATALGSANAPASMLVCRDCGHVEWFVGEPQRA